VSNKAFDAKLDALLALRDNADGAARTASLRKALRDRSNYYVAKAAGLVAEFSLRTLIPDLIAAFDRFFDGGAGLDAQCRAKLAIIEALAELGFDDPAVFLTAGACVQMEPVFGGTEDTAVLLRGTSTLALVQCKWSEHELLTRLVDVLADREKGVRMEAIRAIGQCTARDAALLLRVKANAGDDEAEVIGQCFTTLLEIDAENQVAYVLRFLNADEALRFEALATLSECRDSRAADALIDILEQAEPIAHRSEIFQALGRSRHKHALDFLLATIETGNTADGLSSLTALMQGPQRESIGDHVAEIVAQCGNVVLTKQLAKMLEKI
jgi:HEAT repeat protein